MERHIKFINIIFENCEHVQVPGDAIYHCELVADSRFIDTYEEMEEARSVSISIILNKLKKEDSERLSKCADITHIQFVYISGEDKYVQVPIPIYFHYWYQNPYQDSHKWYNESLGDILDLDFEKYWSILSTWQAVKDYVGMCMHNFPNGMRTLFGGYWATFKRHFKSRH